ncbi:MAG: hypothetical protein CL672_03590 [Balneola sp.]|nr:hypothetical protein [Balneola sp.]
MSKIPFNLLRNVRKSLFFGLIILLAISSIAYQQKDLFFRIKQSLEIFSEAFSLIVVEFVDKIDPLELMGTGLNAMFESLDPYTNYFDASSNEQAEILNRSNFSSIGIQVDIKENSAVVVRVIDGSPAQRSGIRTGDIILSIDGLSTETLVPEEIENLLMGEIGSKVTLTVETQNATIDQLRLSRAKFEPKSLGYAAYLNLSGQPVIELNMDTQELEYIDSSKTELNQGVAYLQINEFGLGVNTEFRQALQAMIEKSEPYGLILDLRGNPGGLLQESIQMLDFMVEPNITVAETKGRLDEYNTRYITREVPRYTGPLVVLIDQGSASASEILSGVVQDLDRGVVVGERSFGKGLVQIIKPLPYNNSMKFTISRYYIPSGRSIQSLEYTHDTNNTAFQRADDNVYKTKNGRVVHGGRGIEPDLQTNTELLSPFQLELLRLGLVGEFVQQLELPIAAIIDDELIQVMTKRFMDNFEPTRLQIWNKMITLTDSLDYFLNDKNVLNANTKESILQINDHITELANDYLIEKHGEIEMVLGLELIRFYRGNQAWKRASLAIDPAVISGIQLLNELQDYYSIVQ